MRFRNRHEAGQILAKKIDLGGLRHPIVLALPRGGVPVAVPVAKRIEAPLEVLIVRKIGAPMQPEFALGALVEDGTLWLNESALRFEAVESAVIEKIRAKEWSRIQEQKSLFRKGRALPDLSTRTVVIVDDGIATGSTVFAAIESLKKQKAGRIIVAVPVCADSTARQIRTLGVELISVIETNRLISVGMWYDDFSQVEDAEVVRALGRPPGESPAPAYSKNPSKLAHQIAERLRPLESDADFSPLIKKFRDKSVVMLGEATHGTSEFYRIRNRISEALIRDEGFSFVAVEGDWPDSERLNRYIRDGRARTAKEVMKGFSRWPTWMWANDETSDFIESQKGNERFTFHGLDVYSLFESMESVLAYAKRVNPFLATTLKERYSCFEPFERDEYAYVRSLQRFPEGVYPGGPDWS